MCGGEVSTTTTNYARVSKAHCRLDYHHFLAAAMASMVEEATNNEAQLCDKVGHWYLMANLQRCQYLPTVIGNGE
jgi:hypothetical protein